MKIFQRLKIKQSSLAAVSDIPADLREVIDKHMKFKRFLDSVYRYTHKDLNKLEISPKDFIKSTRITEADIRSVVNNDDGVLILNIFKRGKDAGLIYLTGHITDFYLDGREEDGLYVNDRRLTILGRPRNVITVLNNQDFTYKAWIIDLSKASSTRELQDKRMEAQRGIIKRYSGDTWGKDKSGYEIDRNKYKRMLQELKMAGNEYTDQISKLSDKFFKILQGFDKNAKDLKSWRIKDVMKALSEAVSESVTSYNSPKDVKDSIAQLEEKIKILEQK